MTITSSFSPYQKLLIGLLAVLLFTVVVDYMLLSALSAILLPELQITTQQFGLLVSAYAFSAGISGILTSGFADKFDRKKLLLFYYGGFLLGMLLSATANSLTTLLIARIVTGIFGGVVASICFAIVSDLFEVDQRGRVMGFVHMAFAASQIIGLPAGLYLANNFYWHTTYWMIALLGIVSLAVVFYKIKPIRAHLHVPGKDNPFNHFLKTLKNRDYLTVFFNNILLVLADVMFMTFGSAYSTNNLGVSLDDLPLLYRATGVSTLLFAPIIGRLADRFGKLKVFIYGTGLAVILVGIYSHLGATPFWLVVTLHTLLFMGVNARMISSSALATVVPKAQDRGAFMAVDASLQQVSGGVAAAAAGLIVHQSSDGVIHQYPALGWAVIGLMVVTIGLMVAINGIVKGRG